VVGYRCDVSYTHSRRVVAAFVVVVALLAAACSPSTVESEVSTTTEGPDIEESFASMCRTLELLSAAGAPPGRASEAITATDLEDATSTDMELYGAMLVSAPRALCPEQVDYADEIAYWLGF